MVIYMKIEGDLLCPVCKKKLQKIDEKTTIVAKIYCPRCKCSYQFNMVKGVQQG